ncbi:MAG: hypothetical protein DCC71_10680 [Proteobacteria bacterium]|nr:MAG: hypothetical protein DCC71_10680 [Pseudomonadota bacterium]
MPSGASGLWLVFASLGFWLSWVLMPGVGLTDAAEILERVGARRTDVLASVALQLASAAAYAPGLAGILCSAAARASNLLWTGCALLLIGAMGSAADAIFHLVAFEMTAPGVAPDAVLPVMRRLQGADLVLLLPFVAAFFAGHAVLLVGARRIALVGALAPRLLALAPGVALVGALASRSGVVSGRVVGLAALGLVSASLAVLGLTIARAARPKRR